MHSHVLANGQSRLDWLLLDACQLEYQGHQVGDGGGPFHELRHLQRTDYSWFHCLWISLQHCHHARVLLMCPEQRMHQQTNSLMILRHLMTKALSLTRRSRIKSLWLSTPLEFVGVIESEDRCVWTNCPRQLPLWSYTCIRPSQGQRGRCALLVVVANNITLHPLVECWGRFILAQKIITWT